MSIGTSPEDDLHTIRWDMTDQKQTGSQPAKDALSLDLDEPDWNRPTETSVLPDFNEIRKTRPEDPFPVRPFMKLESLVDIDTDLECAFIIMEGEAEEFTIGEDGTEMRKRLCLLQAGDIVCPEYFAGLRPGSKSPRSVAATTDGWAYKVRMQDLNDPHITPFLRRERLNLVFQAFGRRNMADLNAMVATRATEKAAEEAVAAADKQARDAEAATAVERAARQPLDQEIADLKVEIAQLRSEKAVAVELGKRITKETVNAAILRRNKELEREIRELTTSNRALERRVSESETAAISSGETSDALEQTVAELRQTVQTLERRLRDAEAAKKSQMLYVESVTDEVREYERLSDLLGLESTDSNRLVEELRRIFLSLYQLKHPKLQSLGVLGLGGLSELGSDLPGGSPSLSKEEVEAGISGATSAKDPGPTT